VREGSERDDAAFEEGRERARLLDLFAERVHAVAGWAIAFDPKAIAEICPSVGWLDG
jgi:hypothetical protein